MQLYRIVDNIVVSSASWKCGIIISLTLQLLWREYRQAYPDGFRYSRFCERYREWAGTLDPVLRQTHDPPRRGAGLGAFGNGSWQQGGDDFPRILPLFHA